MSASLWSGHVVYLNQKNGYGFIRPNQSDSDVNAHKQDCYFRIGEVLGQSENLYVGAEVVYWPEYDYRRNKTSANHVLADPMAVTVDELPSGHYRYDGEIGCGIESIHNLDTNSGITVVADYISNRGTHTLHGYYADLTSGDDFLVSPDASCLMKASVTRYLKGPDAVTTDRVDVMLVGETPYLYTHKQSNGWRWRDEPENSPVYVPTISLEEYRQQMFDQDMAAFRKEEEKIRCRTEHNQHCDEIFNNSIFSSEEQSATGTMYYLPVYIDCGYDPDDFSCRMQYPCVLLFSRNPKDFVDYQVDVAKEEILKKHLSNSYDETNNTIVESDFAPYVIWPDISDPLFEGTDIETCTREVHQKLLDVYSEIRDEGYLGNKLENLDKFPYSLMMDGEQYDIARMTQDVMMSENNIEQKDDGLSLDDD